MHCQLHQESIIVELPHRFYLPKHTQQLVEEGSIEPNHDAAIDASIATHYERQVTFEDHLIPKVSFFVFIADSILPAAKM